MKLIVVHENKNSLISGGGYSISQSKANCQADNLLRFAFCSEAFGDITISCLNGDAHDRGNGHIIALPQRWAPGAEVANSRAGSCKSAAKVKSSMIYYKDNLPAHLAATESAKPNSWFIISNGRFVVQMDDRLLHKAFCRLDADVVTVNVTTRLQGATEKAIITSQGGLIGFRRAYDDLVRPAPVPGDWPHQLFIRTEVLDRLLINDALPLVFSSFIEKCAMTRLRLRSIDIGGATWDLGTEKGLLAFLITNFNSPRWNYPYRNNRSRKQLLDETSVTISPGARLFGRILFGRNASVAANAIIIGPTIIGNDVEIRDGAVVRTSVIGSGISVAKEECVQNRVLISQVPKSQIASFRDRPGQHLGESKPSGTACAVPYRGSLVACHNGYTNNFRTWPKFSYARFFKRIADLVASVLVLALFAPMMPFIALAIILNSPGSVFFGDRRQGLHGKPFKCLKFRTMLAGADKLQDKLRSINQVDGPQFRIEDDPRTSAVGRFLRDTHIDEIPQFINVLLGQMSVVGPRPSPEAENILCPSWRDARLSVRPGITGLWQVCRTRRPMKDFQEWIHYDIEYVRNLSIKLDLVVCWKTIKKLILNFIDQF